MFRWTLDKEYSSSNFHFPKTIVKKWKDFVHFINRELEIKIK